MGHPTMQENDTAKLTPTNSIVNEADKLVCSDFNIITICNKIEKIYENM